MSNACRRAFYYVLLLAGLVALGLGTQKWIEEEDAARAAVSSTASGR